MEFRVLGPLEAVAGEEAIPLGGPRQRTVLALLLLRANRVVASDVLLDELWGDDPPRTAANTLQAYISQLRKLLGTDRIVSRPPGYLLRLDEGELDLHHFERLAASGDPDSLRAALRLWRGDALADLRDQLFVQREAERLEELRLVVTVDRIDKDLAAGRGAACIPEIDRLVAAHPFRERIRGQLMRALYAAGRQADALAAYRDARAALVEAIGIEPGPELRMLEQAILRQDPGLQGPAAGAAATTIPTTAGCVLAALAHTRTDEDALIDLASSLVLDRHGYDLVLSSVVPPAELAAASESLRARASILAAAGVNARTAAFSSPEPSADLAALARDQDAAILLLDAAPDVRERGALVGTEAAVLGTAGCDVGLFVAGRSTSLDGPVVVPFGGAEHDWAAIEIAAWIAQARGTTLQLAGREADMAAPTRDASRLLATASLLVQRHVRVPTEPVLVPAGGRGMSGAAAEGGLVVLGLSERWATEGLGHARARLLRDADTPTLLVRKGLRPGGLAPPAALTRFSWSFAVR